MSVFWEEGLKSPKLVGGLWFACFGEECGYTTVVGVALVAGGRAKAGEGRRRQAKWVAECTRIGVPCAALPGNLRETT
jgi:hypothetical protein